MDARHLQSKTALKPANPCVLLPDGNRANTGCLCNAQTQPTLRRIPAAIAKAVDCINARAKLQTKDDCELVAELLRHLPDEVFSLVLVLTNSILNIQATFESPGRKTHIAMLLKQCTCVPRGTGEKTLHTKIVRKF